MRRGSASGRWIVPALVGSFLLHSGVWIVPTYSLHAAMAKNYPKNPLSGTTFEFLTGSLGLALLARALRMVTDDRYLVVAITATLLCIAGLASALRRQTSGSYAVLVLAMSPALTVCMQWLGMPDILVITLCGLCVLSRRPSLTFLTCLLLPMAHREQTLMLLPELIICREILRCRSNGEQFWGGTTRSNIRRLFVASRPVIVGAFIGQAIATVLIAQWTPSPITGRAYWLVTIGGSAVLSNVIRNPMVSLWTMLGPGWFIVWFAVRQLRSESAKQWGSAKRRDPVLVAIVGCLTYAYLTTAIALDFTRVSSILSFPVYIVCALVAFPTADSSPIDRDTASESDAHGTRLRVTRSMWMTPLIAASILTPRIVLIDGHIFPSLAPYSIRFAERALTGRLGAWMHQWPDRWTDVPFERRGWTPIPLPKSSSSRGALQVSDR
jgi:hypothetical protein